MSDNVYVWSNIYADSIQPAGTTFGVNTDTVVYYFPPCEEIRNRRVKSIIFTPRDVLQVDKYGSPVIGTLNNGFLNLVDTHGDEFLQDVSMKLFDMAGEMVNVLTFAQMPVVDWQKSFIRLKGLSQEATGFNVPFIVDYV